MSTCKVYGGVNAAGTYGRQTYHIHVLTVLKSESLKTLEPSAPVQGCTGMALRLPLHCTVNTSSSSYQIHGVP